MNVPNADYNLASRDGGVDRTWYLQTYPDVAAAGADSVEHYLQVGWQEGRDPRPDFSTSGYLQANKEAEGNPLIHYLRHGGTKVPPLQWQWTADYNLASGDGGVDRTWYLQTYPDVAATGTDSVEHYLQAGWQEGRDPRPDFSTSGYLQANKEVEGNPLVHYLRHGGTKVPPPQWQFNADYNLASRDGGVDRTWYLQTYPDVAATGTDSAEHYLQVGWQEGRDPRPDFSTSGYLQANKEAEGNPLIHYLRHGGTKVPPLQWQWTADYNLASGDGGVDRTWYLQTYPDVAATGTDSAEHYLQVGWQEGRDPRPDFSTSGYLQANKEVEGNPLIHYLRHGGTKVPPPQWQFNADYNLASRDGGVDRTWYLQTYPDVAATGVDSVEHYLQVGWQEGRDPRPDFSTSGYLQANKEAEGNPLIHYLRHGGTKVPPLQWQWTADYNLASGDGGVDRTWYLQTYPDVAATGTDSVEHYLQAGWQEGRDPRPDFSTSGYLQANKEVEGNPLVHYLRHGGTKVPPPQWQFNADYNLASRDGGVDRTWYLQTYPDVAAAGADSVEHYLQVGWQEGRDPRPDFSTSGYLQANKEAEGNPLIHYLRHGGTKVPPLQWQWTADYNLASGDGGVDRTWYLQTYPDVAATGTDSVEHYLQAGWQEGRDPRPDFSTSGYLQANKEVEGNPLVHYLRHGGTKVPPPQWQFNADYNLASRDGGVDRTWYLQTYPDVAAAGADSVEHYLQVGWQEGRDPRPDFSTSGYLQANKEAEGNPLIHYLRHGGTKVPPLQWQWTADYNLASGDGGVDRTWYLQTYPDVAATGTDSAEHYLQVGWQEGRDPRPDFSTSGYLQANKEVEGNPLIHYLRHGGTKVPPPQWQFNADYNLASRDGGVDRTWYLQTYPDVAATGVDSVEHYLQVGWQEGRDPRPDFSTSGYLQANKEVEGNPLTHYLRHIREAHSGGAPVIDWYLLWKKGCLHTKGGQEPPLNAMLGSQGVPKIVFTGHEASRTDAPLILLCLMKAIQSLTGAELYLILERSGPLLEDYERIAHVFVNHNGMLYLPNGPNIAGILKSIADPGPTLAICNSADGWRVVKALREAGLPHLISLIHERVVHYSPDIWRSIHQNSNRVIFSAHALKAATTAVLPEFQNAFVAPQGLLKPEFGLGDRDAARIDVRKKLGLSPNTAVILGCGDLFVQLAARVRARSTGDVHFLWLDPGQSNSYSARFIELDISLLDLSSHVSLLGEVADPEPYLLAADAFALTSRDDPFPCVIHEAMACALPIVVFDGAGGAKEAISDGCGIVVPYMDIDAMATLLTSVVDNPLRYATMGQRAEQRVRSVYRFSDYAERIKQICASIKD